MAKLAVVGVGKMGEALIAGLLASGWRKPDQILVTGRRPERLEDLSVANDIETSTDNAGAVSGATTSAIQVLEQSGVRAAFLNAIQAAMERSRALAGGEPEA